MSITSNIRLCGSTVESHCGRDLIIVSPVTLKCARTSSDRSFISTQRLKRIVDPLSASQRGSGYTRLKRVRRQLAGRPCSLTAEQKTNISDTFAQQQTGGRLLHDSLPRSKEGSASRSRPKMPRTWMANKGREMAPGKCPFNHSARLRTSISCKASPASSWAGDISPPTNGEAGKPDAIMLPLCFVREGISNHLEQPHPG